MPFQNVDFIFFVFVAFTLILCPILILHPFFYYFRRCYIKIIASCIFIFSIVYVIYFFIEYFFAAIIFYFFSIGYFIYRLVKLTSQKSGGEQND